MDACFYLGWNSWSEIGVDTGQDPPTRKLYMSPYLMALFTINPAICLQPSSSCWTLPAYQLLPGAVPPGTCSPGEGRISLASKAFVHLSQKAASSQLISTDSTGMKQGGPEGPTPQVSGFYKRNENRWECTSFSRHHHRNSEGKFKQRNIRRTRSNLGCVWWLPRVARLRVCILPPCSWNCQSRWPAYRWRLAGPFLMRAPVAESEKIG